MNPSSEDTRDPLLGGFYSTNDAARLLQIPAPGRVSRWVTGDKRNAAVIAGDYEKIGGKHALSFWDLMEVRFLEHFRRQGVSMQLLRKIAERAGQEMMPPSLRPFQAPLSHRPAQRFYLGRERGGGSTGMEFVDQPV